MAQIQFNAAHVSPESQFAPVPNGDYPVVITESEMKPTKSGEGQYLQLVLEIIEGPYKGRRIWDRLNLVNPNHTAVEIAQRTLSQICHAVNHLTVQDTVELHNKPMMAKVVVRQSPGYDDANEVKEYKASSLTQAPPPPQQAQAMGSKPAWAS
jgi:hypothetical protein